MTPKEKAEDLVDKFSGELPFYNLNKSKQYALIVVDEILKSPTPKQEKYWVNVKQEIENI